MAGTPDDVVATAEMFGEVARALAAHDDVHSTLQRIVDLAVEHLEACEAAGVSVVERGSITSPVSTGDMPQISDGIQDELGEGPCYDAIKEHAVFTTGDLTSEERWPRFSSRAHEEAGVVSILSVRLFAEEDTMGVLNLYSSRPEAFDETDIALASVFAVHAAVAMQAARREESLERKAASRDVIGQAKGILMARSNIDEEGAFDLLRRASQRMNVKLRDIAERIAHGESLYETKVED